MKKTKCHPPTPFSGDLRDSRLSARKRTDPPNFGGKSCGNDRKGIFIPSKFGKFYLEATDQGLYRLEFPNRFFKRSVKKNGKPPAFLKKAARLLTGYLNGRKVDFNSLRCDTSGFTDFEQKVLKILSSIPAGTFKTYGELARKAGSPGAGRAVGAVMRKNRLPIFLPCHRVIRSGGKWGGYSGGISWKKRLHAIEGAK